ncbi:MAG: hypothetical protein AAFN77_03510 [Planctomycetota bacterium]
MTMKSSGETEPRFLQRLSNAAVTLVSAPWGTLTSFMADLIDSDERLRSAETFGDRLVGFVTLPWRLLLAAGTFILFSWASTRSVAAFVFGAPAIIATVGYFGAVFAADMLRGEARMVEINTSYYDHHTANSPNHPEWAEIFGRRLVEENPDQPNFKYMLAQSLERMGDVEEAEELMNVIAPVQRQGFGPAHLWLANRLTNQVNLLDMVEKGEVGEDQLDIKLDTEALPDELEAIAFQHYQHALNAMPERIQPRFQIARMYELRADRIGEGDPEFIDNLRQSANFYQFCADKSLDFIDAGNPDRQTREEHYFKIVARPSYARLRVRLSKADPQNVSFQEVKAEIDKQINGLLPGVRLTAAEDYRLWLSMIDSALAVDDYRRAAEIVQAGDEAAQTARTKAILKQQAARILVIQAQRIKNLHDRRNYTTRLRVLCESVVNNPRNAEAYVMLLDFIGREAPIEDPSNIPEDHVPVNLDWLSSQGAGSRYSGVIQALVGMHLISQGEVVRGQKNWEIGAQFDRNARLYIHQLLSAAAFRKQDKFSQVNEMLAVAIELFSESAELYFTRGELFKSQGNFEDAIIDYEDYLKSHPEDFRALQVVKLCYRQLNDDDRVIEYDGKIDEALQKYNERDRARATKIIERITADF